MSDRYADGTRRKARRPGIAVQLGSVLAIGLFCYFALTGGISYPASLIGMLAVFIIAIVLKALTEARYDGK